MNKKETENVLLLDPFERYQYFIKKVADWEEFFTLIDEKGDYVLSELDNYELLPLWSTREFAELCKVDGWENHMIKELTLEDLESEFIEFVSDRKCLMNVFPVNNNTGFVVSVDEFIWDMNDELEKIQ